MLPIEIDNNKLNDSKYWDKKYTSNNTNWDMKSSTPVFKELLSKSEFISPCRLLITGSGKGYDAIETAKLNYDVTTVDFSSEANKIAKEIAGDLSNKINYLQTDIFDLNKTHKNYFDAIYEYTTFCAIDPKRRKEYVNVLSDVLKSGGKLVALLFPVDGRGGGPPFNIDIIEFYKLLSKKYILEFSTFKINSIKPRAGKEVLQIYKKR